jgi:hypothetical protein
VTVALRPVQVAYHVPDPVAAAERCARDYGWGPFVLFDHTSAYGQAGEVMVELITQHDDTPSALRDLYAPDQSGLHHVACFVDDLRAELQRFRDRGVAVALDARTQTGVDFAMVDLSGELGHMLELYEPGEDLRRFYAHVRKLADGWTGERPVRRPRTDTNTRG